ncbi:hypothetical protein C8T65DRAFT_68407 [Cerioporus squamosus]|nr:hypothetical protein C8T65DRAFT_68407 [Cerioporus squamosus]
MLRTVVHGVRVSGPPSSKSQPKMSRTTTSWREEVSSNSLLTFADTRLRSKAPIPQLNLRYCASPEHVDISKRRPRYDVGESRPLFTDLLTGARRPPKAHPGDARA